MVWNTRKRSGMNGLKYFADTNCFIYLLDENPLIMPFANDGWAFSYITEIALLSKKENHYNCAFAGLLFLRAFPVSPI